jgi:SNF2 family DNA or RNA helicase
METGLVAGDSEDATEPARAFQEGELDQFVGTISKAGESITLTRADTVIFVDRDWVPGVNRQAEDRLRPNLPRTDGRKVPVSVIILEVPDTVDSGKVASKNRIKSQITKQVLG